MRLANARPARGHLSHDILQPAGEGAFLRNLRNGRLQRRTCYHNESRARRALHRGAGVLARQVPLS